MNETATPAEEIGGVISSFAAEVPGVRDAVVVSADGLLIAMSYGMSRGEADRFAAVASGLVGLAHGASKPFGGGDIHQIIIEMTNAFVFVTGIADGSALAVIAEAQADVALVGYETACLVERCGQVFDPLVRAQLQESLER